MKRDGSMKRKTLLLKFYSIAYLVSVLLLLVSQLFVSGITVDSVPEDYLLKDDLIKAYRKFKFDIGDRVFPSAVVGKDGWLFYTGEMSLRDYQKIDPLNISNIKKLVGVLNQMDAAVQGYGGTLLVIVPPDKSTIYPHYMPDQIPVIGTTTSLDRLIERTRVYGKYQLLDLRPTLIQASQSSHLYYKTDTHWNCLGAFYAYEDVISNLIKIHPELPRYRMNDFNIDFFEVRGLDIARQMGTNIVDTELAFTPKFEIDGTKETPGLMVVHDSFYNACLHQFFEATYQDIVRVPYVDVELADILEMIEKEKPKTVLVEFAERFMDYFLWHLYE